VADGNLTYHIFLSAFCEKNKKRKDFRYKNKKFTVDNNENEMKKQ
jgi:hypothetical protein